MNLRSSLNAAYLLLTGIAIFGVLIVFTVFKPLYTTIQQKRATYVTRQQAYAQSVAFLDTVDRKKTELDADAAQERALSVALPATDAAEDVTRLVQRAAQESGVTITKLTNANIETQRNQAALNAAGDVGSSAVAEHVAVQSMGVSMTGAYAQTRVFLSALSKTPRLIDVTALLIGRPSSSVDQITSQVTLEFYKYKAN